MDRRKMLRVVGAGAGMAALGGAQILGQEDRGRGRDEKEGGREGRGRGVETERETAARQLSECATSCNAAFHHAFEQMAKRLGQTGQLGQGEKQNPGRQGQAQDPPAIARHLHVALDCAQVCATAAALLARQSTLAPYACDAAARACDHCVSDAENLEQQYMDAVVKRMVEDCRTAARHARDFSKEKPAAR